jgi:tetratricopeptide (TPR) repeat protein
MAVRAHGQGRCWIAFLIVLAVATPVLAQQRWTWPDKAKNLDVLPADTPPAQLRAAMMGFTRALGVRCTHCHVGEEGKPLSTYDFASDANPKKDVARGMMRMVGAIGTQLEAIQPAKTERVLVSCATCHRGRPLPLTLEAELARVYAKSGADSTLAHYARLRQEFYGAGAYDFHGPALNELGSRALGGKDTSGALAIFRKNVEEFPDSENAHTSLAEAYVAAGDTLNAIAAYQRVLQIDPKNERAAKALDALRR